MQAYLRILGYGRPWYGKGAMALAAMLVYTLFSAVSLISIIPFLEILFSEGIPPVPTEPFSWYSTAAIKSHGYYELGQIIAVQGRYNALKYFCGALVLAIILKNIARYLSAYWISPLEQGIIQRIRGHIFSHLSTLDMAFFTRKKKGDLIGLLVSDVQVVQESVIGTIQGILREPLTMLTFLGFLLFISWKLTLFTVLILPLTAFMIDRIRRPLKRRARQGQQVLGELVSVVDEFVSGIRIVKAFQKEAYEVQRYDKQNQRFTDIQVSIRRLSELASPITEVLSIGVVCAIVLYGASLILSQQSELTAPEFIGFVAMFSQFLAPIKVAANAFAKAQKGIASFHRIETLLHEDVDIKDPAQPLPFAQFSADIEFEGVWFRYEEKDVLQDIRFRMKKGQTVALVGPSGGGKSTLVDLIPRFYDPYRGSIRIDGKDLRSVAVSDLRRQIGNVTQEGILFHDTVLGNIAYGIEQPDREAVIAAARVANAHDFISQLPAGYDTVIGERGTMLSGGQRQRISIARAVLRNPAILILDEATSNLDTESEKLVQEALDNLMTNRTSIVIAHRLSTILKADLILVIQEGKIVESGTSDELLARGGMYKKLYDLQFEG